MDANSKHRPALFLPRTPHVLCLGSICLAMLALATPAIGAECLHFEFFYREAGLAPNPFNNVTQPSVTGRVTLLVIDRDLNMHVARIERGKIYSTSQGTLIRNSRSMGTHESRRLLELPNLWDGDNNSGSRVASGNYTWLTKAESTLCGSKEQSQRLPVIH